MAWCAKNVVGNRLEVEKLLSIFLLVYEVFNFIHEAASHTRKAIWNVSATRFSSFPQRDLAASRNEIQQLHATLSKKQLPAALSVKKARIFSMCFAVSWFWGSRLMANAWVRKRSSNWRHHCFISQNWGTILSSPHILVMRWEKFISFLFWFASMIYYGFKILSCLPVGWFFFGLAL